MYWFDGTFIDWNQYTGESLAEKIAIDLSQIKREKILKFPQFIQNAFFIIDFDTELIMEGIYGCLENSIGQFFPNIIRAFRDMGDENDANILSEIILLLQPEELRKEILEKEFEEYDITCFEECHKIDEETKNHIEQLENKLYLKTGFDMWTILFAYLDAEIVKYTSIPNHLLEIFQIDSAETDEFNLEGNICCNCDCEEFEIKVFAFINKDHFVQIDSYKDDYALVMKVICKDSRKEWLLFDMSRHGYNGFVCHDGITVPDSELKEYVCPECGERYFKISVGLELEDKAQFMEEVVQEDPDHFSKDDYAEAFDWINIDIKCSGCDKQMEGWLNLETS